MVQGYKTQDSLHNKELSCVRFILYFEQFSSHRIVQECNYQDVSELAQKLGAISENRVPSYGAGASKAAERFCADSRCVHRSRRVYTEVNAGLLHYVL